MMTPLIHGHMATVGKQLWIMKDAWFLLQGFVEAGNVGRDGKTKMVIVYFLKTVNIILWRYAVVYREAEIVAGHCFQASAYMPCSSHLYTCSFTLSSLLELPCWIGRNKKEGTFRPLFLFLSSLKKKKSLVFHHLKSTLYRLAVVCRF